MSFVHLHNHTQYSVLDGACHTEKIVKLAKEMGMPAVAMTDHGNMFGTVDFYKTAQKEGIKPIIGLEAYIVENDFDHFNTKNDERYHLVLLVKNDIGYRNLTKLSSYSYTQGFYYKPRICRSLLTKYHEGLICLSGCIKGEIPQKLLKQSKEAGIEALEFYKSLFGEDFYIELQAHNLEDENKVMPQLIALAKETNTPMVVTNDCHYLKASDAEAHDVLLCIQTGKMVSEGNRLKYPANMYFKTEKEMRELFPDIPEAADNTLKIADLCNFELKYDSFLLPKMNIPEQFKDEGEYLRDLCQKALIEKYPPKEGASIEAIQERLDYELSVIHRMGFDGYFLVVKDIVDAARERNIPVGPGRGSAAGSIVSYLLDITRLDPLKYQLFFERFLNPDRISMPDIDIDFCAKGRAELIENIIERYGRDSITQIITFGTLGAKSVIKDVCRTMEVSVADANALTKLIPGSSATEKITLEESLKKSPEFQQMVQNNPLYQKIFNLAQVIEGLIRQIGVHAAGVVIGPGDLTDYVPLATSSSKEGESVVLVQYEGKWLDDLKLLKMDILGLKTLTVIKRALALIKEFKNIDIDIDKVDLSDKKTYELLSAGETDGIFQFESDGMKKYLRDLKPTLFEDLIAMVALYRPGPMQFIDTFINRKYGREKVTYDHPLIANALKTTYGVTVYQEQVMQISREIGGFTGGEADTLRKAMGKKNPELMKKLEEKFITGAIKTGLPRWLAEKIWLGWLDFASYAFNKSHSACYAFVAFQTAYLKAHYPVEYMTALLSEEEDSDKISQFIAVAKKMNIEILRPSINQSNSEFKVIGNKILFGLTAIKNVGTSAVGSIITERDANGEFTDFFSFCERIESQALNKAVVESLIYAGALDELPGNRAQKLAATESALFRATQQQSTKNRGQLSLFDMMNEEEKAEEAPTFPNIPEWDEKTKLDHEKDVLGFYISGHPLTQFDYLMTLLANMDTRKITDENLEMPPKLQVFGVVTDSVQKRDKKGNPFYVVHLEDPYGRFEMTLFDKIAERYKHLLYSGNKLYITGTQSNFQGNTNETMLRINPDKIVEINEVNKAKGEIVLHLREEDATPEFANYLISYAKQNPGNYRLKFIVKSTKFPEMHLLSRAITITPSREWVYELQEKRNLLFSGKCDIWENRI